MLRNNSNVPANLFPVQSGFCHHNYDCFFVHVPALDTVDQKPKKAIFLYLFILYKYVTCLDVQISNGVLKTVSCRRSINIRHVNWSHLKLLRSPSATNM